MALKSDRQNDAGLPLIQVAMLLVAGIALVGSVPVARLGKWESLPSPFVWFDVALVHFLCAVPLSGILTGWILRRTGVVTSLLFGGLSLTVGLLVMLQASSTGEENSATLTGPVVRGIAALGAALAATLVTYSICLHFVKPGNFADPDYLSGGRRYLVLAMAVLIVAPAVYVTARARHDLNELNRLLGQSRLGEAQALAHRLSVLNPNATWQGHSLPEVSADLDRKIAALQARVAAPLAAAETGPERVNRARDLAILGRTAAAIELLRSDPELSQRPDTWNLLGTIYESRREWIAGRDAYQQARQMYESLPTSPESTANLARAWTGIAYCERKSGRYSQAEAAYLQLLALSPSADTHFLLAQFYEDSQRASLAQAHARQAMALTPERYQQKGLKLIDKLVTLHFGCWGVFSSEYGRSAHGSEH